MAKLKIATKPSVSNVTYPQPQGDKNVSPIQINGKPMGGVGGDTAGTGLQLQGQTYVKGSASTTGYIVAQKGAHKFLVVDGNGKKGICTLVNSPNPTAGQMNVLIYLNACAANIAAANVAGGATSTTITFDTRTAATGPVTFPRVGDYISFTAGAPSANIGSFVQVIAVTGTTSFTIGTVGNVAATNGVTANISTYASKVSNKYVWDWTSDGTPDSTNGTVTFMTSGFNPNRYRYKLGGVADATFVKVQSA